MWVLVSSTGKIFYSRIRDLRLDFCYHQEWISYIKKYLWPKKKKKIYIYIYMIANQILAILYGALEQRT